MRHKFASRLETIRPSGWTKLAFWISYSHGGLVAPLSRTGFTPVNSSVRLTESQDDGGDCIIKPHQLLSMSSRCPLQSPSIRFLSISNTAQRDRVSCKVLRTVWTDMQRHWRTDRQTDEIYLLSYYSASGIVSLPSAHLQKQSVRTAAAQTHLQQEDRCH